MIHGSIIKRAKPTFIDDDPCIVGIGQMPYQFLDQNGNENSQQREKNERLLDHPYMSNEQAGVFESIGLTQAEANRSVGKVLQHIFYKSFVLAAHMVEKEENANAQNHRVSSIDTFGVPLIAKAAMFNVMQSHGDHEELGKLPVITTGWMSVSTDLLNERIEKSPNAPHIEFLPQGVVDAISEAAWLPLMSVKEDAAAIKKITIPEGQTLYYSTIHPGRLLEKVHSFFSKKG